MRNKTREAAAYLRYSCHNQDDGWSIEAQKTAIKKYADANGIIIKHFYIDEAKSGRNTNREGYQALMNCLKKGDIKIVIVHKLDRLHRETANQLNDLKLFGTLGVQLLAIADGIDTNDVSSHLMTVIKAGMAEQYSLNLAVETRKGLIEAASSGLHCGGMAPLGFEVDDNKRLVVDEQYAPAIRQIYKMYDADMGYSVIIQWLKEHGYKTRKGNDFSKSAINSILKNEKYAGIYTYDKTAAKNEAGKRNSHKYKDTYIRIEGGCPAIIDMELFERVQKKMADRKHRNSYKATKHYYPLNGKVFGENNNLVKYSGRINHSNGKKYHQYTPVNGAGPTVNGEQLDEAVFYALKLILFSKESEDDILAYLNEYSMDVHQENNADTAYMINKKATLEKRLEKLVDNLETDRPPKAVLSRIEVLENEIKELTDCIETLSEEVHIFTKEEITNLKKKFVAYMRTSQTLSTKELIDKTIKSIKVGEENVEIKFNPGIATDSKVINYFKN